MKRTVSLFSGLLLISSPFSLACAGSAVPDLAGKWHSTAFNELAGRQLNKMHGHLETSNISGVISSSIEQSGRNMIIKTAYKLSAAVIGHREEKKLVDELLGKQLCVIAHDNTSFYCVTEKSPHYVFGKIENENTINFIEMEAGQHRQDPYVLSAILVKDVGAK